MALNDPARSGPLACGVALDDLIAQVIDGSAPLDRAHQAACRYCQAALDAVREAWEEFQQAARAAVAVPEDLAERVMSRIRALARAGDVGVVIDQSLGQTQIADTVLARLARVAALAVEHVRWVSVLSAQEDADQAGRVSVSLRLVATYGPELPAIAAEVREQVQAVLSKQAGVSVARVDVAVEDVVDESQNF